VPEADTAATRVAPRGGRDPRTAPKRAPRQVQARRPGRQDVPDSRRPGPPERAPQRSGGRGFRRMMGLLALLAVLALIVIAAVVISDSTSNMVVHYKKVVANDAQSAISQVESLINQYTK